MDEIADLKYVPPVLTEEKHLMLSNMLRDGIENNQIGQDATYGILVATAVRWIAYELFAALDLDGGRATAELQLGMVNAGKITGEYYIDRACGCFYGSMMIAQHPDMAQKIASVSGDDYRFDNLPDDEDDIVDRFNLMCRVHIRKMYQATGIPTRLHTRMEDLIMNVRAGHLPENHLALRFLQTLLLLYIEQRPVVAETPVITLS